MAHRTLSIGSTGPDVKDLQDRLNALPSSLAMLKLDGIFGPQTQARAREFQGQRKLKQDGIVGPLTWAALDQPPAPQPAEPAWTRTCGNGDGEARTLAPSSLKMTSAPRPAPTIPPQNGLKLMSFPSIKRLAGDVGLSLPSLSIPGLTRLADTNLVTSKVQAYFGYSVDFSRVYVTNRRAAGIFACTISVNVNGRHLGLGAPGPKDKTVQIMNLGPHPTELSVIHQMTHVWQCQHCVIPALVAENCATSRYQAWLRNRDEGQSDPSLARFRDYPYNYPYSPFAHIIDGKALAMGAEQMAQAVQDGEDEAVGLMVAWPAGKLLGIPFCYQPAFGDRRRPEYKM
jgi:Putative peptidoglycan binding domain